MTRNPPSLLDLLAEWQRLRERGEEAGPEQLCPEAPQLWDELRREIDTRKGLEQRFALAGGSTVPEAIRADVPLDLPQVPGYEVLGELGRGGCGVVYRARQVSLGRIVALKMILSGSHAGFDERVRFHREAEAIARLQHPNIVQVFEVGERDGMLFFSLELCAGGTLQKALRGTPLPPHEAARVLETLARAAQAAHEKGVLHRDFKPANVLLLEDATLKISDFGLARKIDDPGQTRAGAIMGTPSYMSPEQASGQVHALDARTDVYALGAILYECLTGWTPFKGATSWDTIRQVLNDEPVPPRQRQPKVPRDLETICLKCLDKKPERRYSSALTLAHDLERFRAGEPILAHPPGILRKLGYRLRRQRIPLLAGLVVLLALVAALVFTRGSHTTRAVGALVADLQVGLNVVDWTPEHAEQLHDLLGRLQPLDPACAEELRQQVFERHKQAVLQELARPRLEGEDVARLRLLIAAVAQQDAEVGKELTGLLTRRMREWEPALNLSAPFTNWTQSLSGQQVALESGKLRFRPRTLMDKIVPVSVPCAGNAWWTARFDPGWESAPEVGIGLNFAPGHTAMVNALVFSPDNRLLASGASDHQVMLWDLETRTLARTLREEGEVKSLAFSPSGSKLYAAAGLHLGVWDSATGKRLATRKAAAGDAIRCVAVAPDGKVFAVAGGPIVRLFHPDTLEPIRELTGHTGPVVCLAFSANGLLASASKDGTARLWEQGTGQPHSFLASHTHPLDTLAYSEDGRLLATRANGRLFLWDVAKQPPLGSCRTHGNGHSLTFARGTQQIADGYQFRDPQNLDKGTGFAAPTTHTALTCSSDSRFLAVSEWPTHRIRLFSGTDWIERDTLSGTGYDLVLSAQPNPGSRRIPLDWKDTPITFADMHARGGTFWLQVRRNGAVQVEQPVRVPPGALTLHAMREGDRLSVQVNDLPPLRVIDPLPLREQAAVGLLFWPAGSPLTQLVARRQAEQRAPSLLEQAETLLRLGRAAEALSRFAEQALAGPAGALGQEVRYKIALCLVRLNRQEEAIHRLETLGEEPGERWPLLAAFELWRLRLDAKQLDAADAIFAAIASRFPIADLNRFVPLELRQSILDRYPWEAGETITYEPGRLLRLEILNRLADFLRLEESDPERWATLRTRLARLHWMEGREESARKISRETLERLARQPSSPWRSAGLQRLLETHVWLLLCKGEAKNALAELQRWKPPADNQQGDDWMLHLGLLQMRVRVHWALQDFDAAEKAVDECIRKWSASPVGGHYNTQNSFAHMYVMKGLLREKRGDGTGAFTWWKKGTFRAYQATLKEADPTLRPAGYQGVWDDLALCVWTGEKDDAEFAQKFQDFVRIYGEGSMLAKAANLVGVTPALLRDVWNSPRGRKLVRQSVFHEIPLRDYQLQPLFLVGLAVVRTGAMPAITEEEEELVLKTGEALYELHHAGKLPLASFLQLGMAWTGNDGFLGWGSVSEQLPPALRGSTAYVLGFRFEKLSKKPKARTFFQLAVKLAPQDSSLAKLAQKQLDRLKTP